MGTGQSGRNLNTQGSGRRVSDFALVHSDEGTLIWSYKPLNRLRLMSGGHGQKGMDLLDRHGIKYNIVKTYSNGVRVGHVPDHGTKTKRSGIAQSWFPRNWTDRTIRRAGEHVAGLKSNKHMPNGKIAYGDYKGVRVGVIRTNGKIATVFPDSNQAPLLKKQHRRRKKK